MFHGKYTVYAKLSHALIAFIHMNWISAITNVLARQKDLRPGLLRVCHASLGHNVRNLFLVKIIHNEIQFVSRYLRTCSVGSNALFSLLGSCNTSLAMPLLFLGSVHNFAAVVTKTYL